MKISGRWSNQNGSILHIHDENNKITGKYKTKIGSADLTKSYKVVGFRNDKCLGFTVSWRPESDSITSWTGLLVKTQKQLELHTLWTLVTQSKIKPNEKGFTSVPVLPWEAFSVQSSIFILNRA